MTANTGEPAINAGAGDSSPPGQGDIPADTFGARLVLARYHAGRLSIEKAAEKCGLNSEGWRRWEDGSQPRDKVEVIQAVSEGLRIDFNWLLLGGPLRPSRKRSPRGTVQPTVQYQKVTEWLERNAARAVRRPRLIERADFAVA
jgi:hypothetical protein